MKNKILSLFFIGLILSGCVGVSSKGIFGTGVSVAFDPRTVGTQVDDSIMQKNLAARILLMDKKYLLSVKTKVLDGRIFLTGKVDKKVLRSLSESDKKNINKMINKLSIKEITDLIVQNSKVSKKEIYNYCLKLKNEK